MTDPSGKRPCLDNNTDILVEILSWLPAKSLLRFRCVCKSWLNLISTSYFIETHLSHGACRDSSRELRLLSPYEPPNFIDYRFPYDGDDGPAESKIVERPCTTRSCSFDFVGSCNGLLCLGDGNLYDLMLWNPCTRERSRFPKQPYPFGRTHCKLMCYGFGYDPTTQDYKVMIGFKCEKGTVKLVVFTLKTNSWRIIEVLNPPAGGFRQYEGCLLNGALHWLGKGIEGKEISTMKIMTFDLGEEKFQEAVPLDLSSLCTQEGMDSSSITSISLGIGKTNGNCLFVYLYNIKEHVCEEGIALTIWVMNEYGIEGSWTKLVRIDSDSIRQVAPRYGRHPKWIFEDGEVFITGQDDMVWDLGSYNLKTKAYRRVIRPCLPNSALYVRTLVSPKSKM